MVPLLSPATVALTGHIVACPCCGMAHALRPLRHHDPRLVIDCGDRTLVMGEGAVLYRRPQLLVDAA